MMGSKGNDLIGRRLAVPPEFRDQNPRRPYTHGCVPFEVLRRAPGGSLLFEEYAIRLLRPNREILEERYARFRKAS